MKRWVEKTDRRSFEPIQINRADHRFLTELLTQEIFIAMGFSPDGLVRRLLKPVVNIPVSRFSRIAVQFDRLSGEVGFSAACRQILPFFIKGLNIERPVEPPREGSLLLVSNHPGAVDSLILAGMVQRRDLKIIASGVPFMRALPKAAESLIYASLDIGERVRVIRDAIKHLRSGGALVLLPSGRIDPDPLVMSGAEDALNSWSSSVGLFVRSVPGLQIIIAVVGGVLSPRILKTPLTGFGNTRMQKQRIAEFVQVLQQMVFPRSITIMPRVHFSDPFTVASIGERSSEEITREIVCRARSILQSAF
ncbi:MAG: hypothetical protein JXA25_10935 [Anaerolineales bacterium]|nr:hypothetical protein [Anaerolineales bacterium]